MKQILATALIIAAVAATEVDINAESSSLADSLNEDAFLSAKGAFVPSLEDDYENQIADPYVPGIDYGDVEALHASHGYDAGHVHADKDVCANGACVHRGHIKQKRRRPPPVEDLAQTTEDGVTGNKDQHKGRTYDWREYEPQLYGGEDPYAACCYPQDTEHLDTPEYQAMPAVCKEELMWQKMLKDGRRQRFFKGPEFKSLFKQDMNLTYDVIGDTMPHIRKKVTHPVGIHSKIEFIAHPDTPYTGLWRGAKHGIMRISDTTATVPHVQKTNPGFGVKLLRDRMESGNFVSMFSFDGQKSWNFFKNRWTTILREPNNFCARMSIGKKLATVTDHPGATSVLELARFDQYGNKEPHPHWPYEINIEPYDVYGWTDKYQNDFRDQLTVIPMNTVMFKVFGFDEAPEFGGKENLMGWLVSRSDQISSFWGDNELFFQHHRMEDDIKARPHYFDWLQFWPEGKFDETAQIDPAPGVKCPFFWLFEQANLHIFQHAH